MTRQDIENAWPRLHGPAAELSQSAIYDRESILAFAVGNPSAAFGEPYRVFDSQRTIARLPGPPYCFMDRVVQAEPPPGSSNPMDGLRPSMMFHPRNGISTPIAAG